MVVRVARVFLLCLSTTLACGQGESGASAGDDELLAAGPDPIVIRLPRTGGVVRAFKYPKVDSAIWRAAQATPALDRILAFDPENGVLAFADSQRSAGWVDLHLGTVRRAGRGSFANIISADGWSIYGLASDTSFVRMTPSGDWSFVSSRKIRRLFPTPDGTLLVLGTGSKGAPLYRLRPPDDVVTDSALVDGADRAAVTPVGDRVYVSTGRRLVGIPPNDIASQSEYRAGDEILAIAPTPSGDRVFVANRGSERLQVVSRYDGNVSGSVKLPGFATELRVDPVGRYLLARPARGDSAWVIDVGTEALVATVATAWRADLPALVVDGRIVTLRGNDVAFVSPTKPNQVSEVPGGGADLWFFARWNGFRPRARGIDRPVQFALGFDSAPAVAPAAPVEAPVARDTVATARADSAVPPPVTKPAEPSPTRTGWTVSFAAVLSRERALEIAALIRVEGTPARVIEGETSGTTVYRVILGPYPTREDAERVGRASKHSFWVYEGVP